MKDALKNKTKDKYTLKGFIEERIKENNKLFTKEEILMINTNKNLIKKIYLLGIINSKDCYM